MVSLVVYNFVSSKYWKIVETFHITRVKNREEAMEKIITGIKNKEEAMEKIITGIKNKEEAMEINHF